MKVLVTGGTGWVTRKIQLPSSWDELVKRYQGIVPDYLGHIKTNPAELHTKVLPVISNS